MIGFYYTVNLIEKELKISNIRNKRCFGITKYNKVNAINKDMMP